MYQIGTKPLKRFWGSNTRLQSIWCLIFPLCQRRIWYLDKIVGIYILMFNTATYRHIQTILTDIYVYIHIHIYTYRYIYICTLLKQGWEVFFHAGSGRSWPRGPAQTRQISLERSLQGITNVLLLMGGLLVTPWTRVGPPRRVLRAVVRQIGCDMWSWMAEQSRWARAHPCPEWGLRVAGS
jgi:hypothetical protein